MNHKDKEGTELLWGDTIVYHKGSDVHKGKLTGFTTSKVRVDHSNILVNPSKCYFIKRG